MSQLPTTVKGLLDELNQTYPHRCPTKDMTDREIWIATGRRELVDNLLARFSHKPNGTNEKEYNFVFRR